MVLKGLSNLYEIAQDPEVRNEPGHCQFLTLKCFLIVIVTSDLWIKLDISFYFTSTYLSILHCFSCFNSKLWHIFVFKGTWDGAATPRTTCLAAQSLEGILQPEFSPTWRISVDKTVNRTGSQVKLSLVRSFFWQGIKSLPLLMKGKKWGVCI